MIGKAVRFSVAPGSVLRVAFACDGASTPTGGSAFERREVGRVCASQGTIRAVILALSDALPVTPAGTP